MTTAREKQKRLHALYPLANSGKLGDASAVAYTLVRNIEVHVGNGPAQPTGVIGYFLAGTTRSVQGRPATVDNACRNIGIRWDTQTPSPTADEKLEWPGPLLAYHVWRTKGATQPYVGPPEESEWRPMTSTGLGQPGKVPQLVVAVDGPEIADLPAPLGWPDIRLFHIEVHDADGWYSYAVSARDVFGRCSPRSDPASWQTFDRGTDAPAIWYDKYPVHGGVLNKWSIEVRDATPPPAPSGLMARLEDFRDPYSISHAAMLAGQAGHPGLSNAQLLAVKASAFWQWRAKLADQSDAAVALQVRWRWTYDQALQAPDVTGFAVYLHLPAAEGAEFTAKNRGKRVAEIPYTDPHRYGFEPIRDRNGTAVEGKGAAQIAGLGSVIRIPQGPTDLALLRPGVDVVELAEDIGPNGQQHILLDVMLNPLRFVLAGDVILPAGSVGSWRLGAPFREYEVFVPAKTLIPMPPESVGIFTARVGVTAFDSKPDHNESLVSGPVLVQRVRRGPEAAPPTPLLYEPSTAVATRADPRGRSFYTVHWTVPNAQRCLSVQLYTARREQLVRVDVDHQPRPHSDWLVSGGKRRGDVFAGSWATAAKRVNAVLGHLTDISKTAKVHKLSQLRAGVRKIRFDIAAGKKAAAGLKGPAAAQDAGAQFNKGLAALGKKLLSAQKAYRAARAKVIEQVYDNLPDAKTQAGRDVLRVLANLSGNERAFSPATNGPVRNGCSASDDGCAADELTTIPDMLGPSDEPGYKRQPDRRSWTLDVDGSTPTWLLVRARSYDAAGNPSLSMSPAMVPVQVPNVVPPPAPVLVDAFAGTYGPDGTKHLAKARTVTLRWIQSDPAGVGRWTVRECGPQGEFAVHTVAPTAKGVKSLADGRAVVTWSRTLAKEEETGNRVYSAAADAIDGCECAQSKDVALSV